MFDQFTLWDLLESFELFLLPTSKDPVSRDVARRFAVKGVDGGVHPFNIARNLHVVTDSAIIPAVELIAEPTHA